jgi:hypothetical protein
VAIALALCLKKRKGIAAGPKNGTYREALTPIHYTTLFGHWKYFCRTEIFFLGMCIAKSYAIV